MISEFDKNNKEAVSRIHVVRYSFRFLFSIFFFWFLIFSLQEELINEASHKFMINRHFSLNSKEFLVSKEIEKKKENFDIFS